MHIPTLIHTYVSVTGNMFNTVRGHIFQWSLLKDDEVSHQQPDPDAILSFVPFEDSSYSTDPIINLLEDRVSKGGVHERSNKASI